MPPKEWVLGLRRESGKSRLTTSWFDIVPVIYQSLKRAGLDGMAEYSIGCCPVDMEDKVEEMLDPIYEAEVELWLCSRVSQTLDFTSVSHS